MLETIGNSMRASEEISYGKRMECFAAWRIR